jgi:Uma2 family endonuclease
MRAFAGLKCLRGVEMSTTASIGPRTRRKIPTDRQLMAMPKDGYKRELLHGEIVMTPAGSEHGGEIAQFIVFFGGFVYEHRLGRVFDGQTGFRMKSRDVLSPDISFVTAARLRELGGTPKGFFEGAPDLAIEFLSPKESKRRLRQKLIQYFDNGAKLAWVMNSKLGTVAVYHDPETFEVLKGADVLSGEFIAPGFTIAVSRIFAGTV